MQTEYHYGPPPDDAALTRLMEILGRCFNTSREQEKQYVEKAGRETIRMLAWGETIVGGLSLHAMGQFFGGKSVPMAGIALVGIDPAHRGHGSGTIMMQETIREIHASGVALSALYPATLPLYRRVGYEQAGMHHEIKISLAGRSLGDRTLSIREVEEDDWPAIKSLYQAKAVHYDGHLDRNEFLWKRIRARRELVAKGYAAFRDGVMEGYVFLMQKEEKGFRYSLRASDLVASTPAAARRLLALIADHGSLAATATWSTFPSDPVITHLPEVGFTLNTEDPWMLRIVNVKKALEQRGYPHSPDTELHLKLTDDLIKENHGPWLLRIENGVGQAEPGGRGELALDIRGLASLYSGFHTPREVALSGLGEGSPEVLDRAEPIFQGSNGGPCMVDGF